MSHFDPIAKTLAKIGYLVRWSDWGPGKIPVLCTVLGYIAIAYRDLSLQYLSKFTLFIVYASIHSALGYVANDWGDREIDKLHGKRNAFHAMSHRGGVVFVTVFCLLAFGSGLPFIHQPLFLWLWAGWAFFALAYSLRPIRLKERGRWGLAVSALAQWTLPVMLAFAAMGRFGKWDMLIFVLAGTVSGATLEVAHQRWDRARDQQTTTMTFGASTEMSRLDRLYSGALVLDKIAIGAVIVMVYYGVSHQFSGMGSLTLGLPLLLAYTVLLVVAVHETLKRRAGGGPSDPYYSTVRNGNKLLHEIVPNFLTPAYVLMVMTILWPINGIMLAAFLYWRITLGRADWRWPFRVSWSLLSKS
jgi:4-hydroxybenzoate polyprenyltransferase